MDSSTFSSAFSSILVTSLSSTENNMVPLKSIVFFFTKILSKSNKHHPNKTNPRHLIVSSSLFRGTWLCLKSSCFFSKIWLWGCHTTILPQHQQVCCCCCCCWKWWANHGECLSTGSWILLSSISMFVIWGNSRERMMMDKFWTSRKVYAKKRWCLKTTHGNHVWHIYLLYLPTCRVDFYTIHGSYGKTPNPLQQATLFVWPPQGLLRDAP